MAARAPAFSPTAILPCAEAAWQVARSGDSTTGASAGSARLISGKTDQALYTFRGEEPVQMLGTSVAGLTELNGDPFPDVVVGSPLATSPSGWIYTGKVAAFAGNDLFLQAKPNQVYNGQAFRLTSVEGIAGNPLLLAIVKLNHTVMFVPLLFGYFDPVGRWQIDVVVPPDFMSSWDITFRTFTWRERAGHRQRRRAAASQSVMCGRFAIATLSR